MPLSDHEKRTLAEMEAALAAEDPRLVSTLSTKVRAPRQLLRGVTLLLLGMATLLIGLVAKIPAVSIIGFLIAVFGTFSAISRSSQGSSFKAGKKSKSARGGSFSDRMQRRWDERN